jgi:hypothetical protein
MVTTKIPSPLSGSPSPCTQRSTRATVLPALTDTSQGHAAKSSQQYSPVDSSTHRILSGNRAAVFLLPSPDVQQQAHSGRHDLIAGGEMLH